MPSEPNPTPTLAEMIEWTNGRIQYYEDVGDQEEITIHTSIRDHLRSEADIRDASLEEAAQIMDNGGIASDNIHVTIPQINKACAEAIRALKTSKGKNDE